MYRTSPKFEAQDQLAGKTHYVDNDTLRFHHSRIISCDIAANGLLFWLVESVSLDMKNTQRGFRFVVFDVFGNVITRAKLEDAFKTSKQANKACREYLATVDALEITLAAMKAKKDQDDKENG